MKPCGKKDRVCSPYDLIMSNGRYYMLGADLKTERSDYLKYKLYRVDLMSDLSITKMKAKSREEAEIKIRMISTILEKKTHICLSVM